MPKRDWESWMWHQAEDLLHQAEKIRWSFLEAAAQARSDPLLGHPNWGPPVNVIETEEALWIIAALPGVEAEEVEIRIEDDLFVLMGRRTFPDTFRGGRLHAYEIPSGSFERRIRLPAGFRFKLGEKKLSQGILSVELKKIP